MPRDETEGSIYLTLDLKELPYIKVAFMKLGHTMRFGTTDFAAFPWSNFLFKTFFFIKKIKNDYLKHQ